NPQRMITFSTATSKTSLNPLIYSGVIMQAKIDSKVFEEMISTETSYNNSLTTLFLALSSGDCIKENLLLVQFKQSITVLKGISDDLQLNAEVSFEENTSEKAHLLLRNQRVNLLSAFFSEYKNYIKLYDTYLTQQKQNPTQFDKINEYFAHDKIQPGFEAHLIQPIQRGPRYQLLIAAAQDNTKGVTERNIQELNSLQELVKSCLFAANSNSTKDDPYWFGKITYTLLWGNSGQSAQVETPQTTSVALLGTRTEDRTGYQPGDLMVKPLGRLLTSLFNKQEPQEPTTPADNNASSNSNGLGNG
ncbi:MAG: RhoGEF domain-containing protein, partial [Legionella sp.]